MKLTSQTLLVTCLMPSNWPAKIVLTLNLRRLKQIRPQLVIRAAPVAFNR